MVSVPYFILRVDMSFLRADKLMESVLGLDKSGIGQLRTVEYAKKYLWEVSFGGSGDQVLAPPAPFEEFIPAIDIDFDEAVLENYTFDQYMSSYEVPFKTGLQSISMTVNDDADNTLFKWMSDWINIDILNHGHFISALLDDHWAINPKKPNDLDDVGQDSFGEFRRVKPLRQMKISLLSPSRSKILTRIFLVIPKGRLAYNGTQASQGQTYNLSFTIIEKPELPQGDKLSMLDQIKELSVDLLGRFI